MTSARPYRRALALPEAIGHLRQGAGSQFDSEVAREVLVVLDEQEAITAPKSGW